MPLYEYKCNSCEANKEVLQKFDDPLQDVVFAHKIWLKRFLSRVSRSRVMVGRRITTALRRRNKPPE